MKYRSKPFEIEASQWLKPGDHPAVQESLYSKNIYLVYGKQGAVRVEVGDFIITEPDGSGHYPCKAAVFTAKYEPLS